MRGEASEKEGGAWCRSSCRWLAEALHSVQAFNVAVKEYKHACREKRSIQRNADITLWDDIRNAYMNELGDITGVDEI